jgi:hypothetical protein
VWYYVNNVKSLPYLLRLKRHFMRCHYPSHTILAFTPFALLAIAAICGGIGQSGDIEATIAAGIVAMQQAQFNLQATIEAAVAATQTANQPLGGQSPPPTVLLPPGPATPSAPPDPQQVRTTILNEVNGAIAQDLTLLKRLPLISMNKPSSFASMATAVGDVVDRYK